jgi:hypothetical protein
VAFSTNLTKLPGIEHPVMLALMGFASVVRSRQQ